MMAGMISAWLAAGLPLAMGGELDPPGGPDDLASAMYTLEAIYQRLDTGAAGVRGVFAEPVAGPAATGRTLDEIMGKAPAQDDADGASPGQVLSGRMYWGLTGDDWGPMAGTMPVNAAVTITPTTTDQLIAAGYHDGLGKVLGDADLASGNIRSGVAIFGVAGDPNVVDTTSGDATQDDIRLGKKAWVAGTEVVGTAVELGYPAPVPRTGQTATVPIDTSALPLADGASQRGVPWPNPRFTDQGDGTVADNLSGLVWHRNGNLPLTTGFDADGYITWSEAMTFVANLNNGDYGTGADGNCGHADWRLPNIREMHSLVDFRYSVPALGNTAGDGKWTNGDPFTNVQSGLYWSSSTYAEVTTAAWVVLLNVGDASGQAKTTNLFAWPVRAGE
jgi:hypothetical protein